MIEKDFTLFSKKELLLTESRTNIEHGHIHEICDKVFHRINYRKITVEMTLFQKYDTFIKKYDIF